MSSLDPKGDRRLHSAGTNHGRTILRADAPDPDKVDRITDPKPIKPRLVPVGVVPPGRRFESRISERTGIVLLHGIEDIGGDIEALVKGRKVLIHKRLDVPMTMVRWDDTGKSQSVSRHMVVRVR